VQEHLRGTPEALEETEDHPDRVLDPPIWIHHQPLVARPDVADWNADPKLSAPRLRDGRIDQPLADERELELAHRPL
jgi:hypothetical protein